MGAALGRTLFIAVVTVAAVMVEVVKIAVGMVRRAQAQHRRPKNLRVM